MSRVILVINPGSTSTKLALFEEENCLVSETLQHDVTCLSGFPRIADQLPLRLNAVRDWLAIQLERLACSGEPVRLAAIAARGGLLRPLSSGTYRVDEAMLAELSDPATVDHASNLAARIATVLMQEHSVPAYCTDPVSVDEMEEVARISGLPELKRRSLSHALSLKAAARRVAAEFRRGYQEMKLVVVHMGSGISVSAHRDGRMVDVNNANDQGPFSPERVGTLPLTGLLELCATRSVPELRRKFWRSGGLMAHLGTNDGREVERRIGMGDGQALLVYRAMAYQVAKEIGAMAAALGAAPDAIVLTGGLANSRLLVEWIGERVRFLGPVVVYPDGDEMDALAKGALRVLRGEEQAMSCGEARPWDGGGVRAEG